MPYIIHTFGIDDNQDNISQYCILFDQNRNRLRDRSSGFGKEYLNLLVSEIRIKDNQAEITGSYSTLAHMVAGSTNGTFDKVSSFAPNWLAKTDKFGHWIIKISA